MYITVLIVLCILIVIIVVILASYSVSSNCQRTISLTYNCDDIYRYFQSELSSVDSVKIKVSGQISKHNDTIISREELYALLNEHIQHCYNMSVLAYEANIFDDISNLKNFKIVPLKSTASLENISKFFYEKLKKPINELGGRLVYVKVFSGDLEGKYAKFKPSDYVS